MKNLHFTQDQITTILAEVASGKEGMHQILSMALEAMMRAERKLHNKAQGDLSNGYRPVKALGQGKQLRLQVPRTRNGSFYPVLLSVLRDQEAACRPIAFRLYGAGLPTKQVGELFDDLYGKHYSTSQISRLFESAREEIFAWLQRPLQNYYPIVYIDATYIYVRREESVSKEAFYTVLGVRPDRTREVLSIVNFPHESASGWKSVFKDLKERGVENIDLFVCDGLSGIEDAIASNFSNSQVQLCVVHLERNVLKNIKSKDKEEVASDLKDVFQTARSDDSCTKGWKRWNDFILKHARKYPALNHMRSERYKLYFTYLQYDYRVRGMLYTTNWIERLNRDYKRTTRMRGALPNPQATILLLGYVAMTRTAYNRKIPKLDYEQKFKWED